jgi:DNA-binding HxlR family transcriptional regulator
MPRCKYTNLLIVIDVLFTRGVSVSQDIAEEVNIERKTLQCYLRELNQLGIVSVNQEEDATTKPRNLYKLSCLCPSPGSLEICRSCSSGRKIIELQGKQRPT